MNFNLDIGKVFKKEEEFVEKLKQEMENNSDVKVAIEGVGKDAEIVTNEQGGKQSKTTMALYLIDPKFLENWVDNLYKALTNNVHDAIRNIASFMRTGDNGFILTAITYLESDRLQQLIRIGKVLQYGADRYEPNNWRLIPQESHINHALIHLISHLAGDTQDDHLDHALCRLMMAYATTTSPNFKYNDYVLANGDIVEVPNTHPDFKPIRSELTIDPEETQPLCCYKYDCDYKEIC